MLLVVLLSFIGCSLAQEVPSIGYITPDIIADIGQKVKLECSVENGKDYPVNWMKLNDRLSDDLISTGNNLAINDPRFSLNKEDGTFTLVIEDFRESDAASYQCQVVISLTDKKTADVSIKVKLPPVISEDTPVDIRAAEGEEVDLLCEAAGFPIPKITWRRPQGALLPNGKIEYTSNTLNIKKVRREDRGEYLCMASNGVGKDVEHSVSLEIGFSPEIFVERPRTPQAPGFDAEIACKIRAFPPPAITWHKVLEQPEGSNHSTIINVDNYDIGHFASGPETSLSKLKISSIKDEQFGTYFCRASNKYGTASEKMELYLSSMPICPPMCNNYNLLSSGYSTLLPKGLTLMGLSLASLIYGR